MTRMAKPRSLLVTGGLGFIGSAFIRRLLSSDSGFYGRLINVDAMSYAGNPDNLADYPPCEDPERYRFVHADIRDRSAVDQIYHTYTIDAVVHFAAESHVDRSIDSPTLFMEVNALGTATLLEAAYRYWSGAGLLSAARFHQVSTDEVYGQLGENGSFSEASPYAPRSPYAASKAAADHIAMAYYHTYGLGLTISHCGNNYGPRQFPEKLIPRMISCLVAGEELPVYGQGLQSRDWIHVDDHCDAIRAVLERGSSGQVYALGARCERRNIDLVHELIEAFALETGQTAAELRSRIRFVDDRPGHDFRYALDPRKIETELGWRAATPFDAGLRETVRWYLRNPDWLARIRSGAYRFT